MQKSLSHALQKRAEIQVPGPGTFAGDAGKRIRFPRHQSKVSIVAIVDSRESCNAHQDKMTESCARYHCAVSDSRLWGRSVLKL